MIIFPVASRRRFGIIRAVGAGRESGENDLLSDFSKPHDKQEASGQSVKINGEYILSRRSIVRMIATITAALMSLYAAVTAHAESIVRRIHDATLGLVLLDRQVGLSGGYWRRLPAGWFVERPSRIREGCRQLACGKVGCADALVE